MRGTFSDRMEIARKAAKMSKAELARASGCTEQNIGQIASGTNRGGIKPQTLFALADALGVHARWLAMGTGPRERGDRIDGQMLERITLDVFRATESPALGWSWSRRLSLSVRLYELWCKTGELPDVGLAVSLFQSPLDDSAGSPKPSR